MHVLNFIVVHEPIRKHAFIRKSICKSLFSDNTRAVIIRIVVMLMAAATIVIVMMMVPIAILFILIVMSAIFCIFRSDKLSK